MQRLKGMPQALGGLSIRLVQRLVAGAALLAALVFFVALAMGMAARGGLASLAAAAPAALELAAQYITRVLSGQPVTTTDTGVLIGRSLALLGTSLGFATLVGLPLGALAAAWRHRAGARGMLFISLLGISAPSFFVALLLMWGNIWVGRRLGVSLPTYGVGVPNLVMPLLVLAAMPAASIARLSYTTLAEVLEADFVRTARSKGLRAGAILTRHVLRSAGVPLLTTVAVSLRYSLAVLPIVERIFAWRGAGLTVLEAIRSGDTALAITMILPFALVLVLVNIVLEITYTAIDPRVRLGEGGAQ